jgi:hypothetical protein
METIAELAFQSNDKKGDTIIHAMMAPQGPRTACGLKSRIGWSFLPPQTGPYAATVNCPKCLKKLEG